jgi:hypothetical protein
MGPSDDKSGFEQARGLHAKGLRTAPLGRSGKEANPISAPPPPGPCGIRRKVGPGKQEMFLSSFFATVQRKTHRRTAHKVSKSRMY